MDKYISKDDVRRVISKAFTDKRFATVYDYAILVDEIDDIPNADLESKDKWISCKDKMPEEYKTVLVYEKDYGVMIGELEKKFFDTQYFIARKSGLILRTTEVTHWQPLPEPPKQ